MKEPITERLAEAPEAEGLLREAMELLGAIGVSKAGKHERHNACVIRNRIDAYLQHQQMAPCACGCCAASDWRDRLTLGRYAPTRPRVARGAMLCGKRLSMRHSIMGPESPVSRLDHRSCTRTDRSSPTPAARGAGARGGEGGCATSRFDGRMPELGC